MSNIIQLIEGCRNQDTRSQKMLYERFFGYGLKIAFRYVYCYETAVKVTNDGFVKIFRNINKFRLEVKSSPESLFMAWMKYILINTAIDELRKNNMNPETGRIPDYVWQQPDDSQGPDQLLFYKELIIHIKKLPTMYRIVFNMFVIDGCTHIQIASILGISVGTSKSNLSRARVMMQSIINGKEKVKSGKHSGELCS